MRFPGFTRDRRGSVSILAAVGLLLAMSGGAVAVDLGSVFYESRRLQGVADAAALSAAGNISAANSSAQAAVTAAGWVRTITPVVTTGTYTADPAVAPSARFVAGGSTPNAARVQAVMDTPLYFGRVFGVTKVHLARSATATRIDLASISLGTRLASLDQGIANQLLSGLIGSSVSLSVNDYNALANTDIDLLGLVGTLKTQLGLTVATYTQTLATTVTLPQVLTAVVTTLNASGQGTAAAAVSKLIATVPSTQINLSQLIDLGAIGQQDRATTGQSIGVNALDTVRTLLQTAGGSRQVQLNLAALAPGLASVGVTLAMGDRPVASPWITITNTGQTVVTTTQTRLYFDTSIGGNSLLQALGISSVRVPLYIELASAQAKLSSLTCTANSRSATVLVQPSTGHMSLADISTSNLNNMAITPTESPATIVNILGLKVTGTSRTDFASNAWQTVPFSQSEIDARATKTVSSSGVVSALTGSLLGKLVLTVSAGPFGVSSAVLTPILQPVLTTLGTLLDPLVSSLLNLLGIHLGQADVRVNGVRCGTAALVA